MVSRLLIAIAVVAWIASGCLEHEDCYCDPVSGECKFNKKQDSSLSILSPTNCLNNCRTNDEHTETPSEEYMLDKKQDSRHGVLPPNDYLAKCREPDNRVDILAVPQATTDIQSCSTKTLAWFEPFIPQWENIGSSLRAMNDTSKAKVHGTYGRTILHFLVSQRNANISELKDLLDVGVDINAVDDYGQTPLHLAAISNQIEIVELLLEYGADVHYQNDAGSSALLLALLLKHDIIVQALLQSNKRIATQGSNDAYPNEDVDALHVAIHVGSSEAIFEQILEFGKDKGNLKRCDNEWRDINVWYWRYSEFDADKTGQDTEPNVGGVTISRVGPLIHHTIHKCRTTLMKRLLDLEGHLECKDPDGATPLHVAVERCPEVVDDFIVSETSVNEQDSSGQTPLHYAAKQGNEIVIRKLVDSGACLITKDNNDLTAIEYAESSNHPECLHLLKNLLAEEAVQELAKACSETNTIEDDDGNNHITTVEEYEDLIETDERNLNEGEDIPYSSSGLKIREHLFAPLALIAVSFFIL